MSALNLFGGGDSSSSQSSSQITQTRSTEIRTGDNSQSVISDKGDAITNSGIITKGDVTYYSDGGEVTMNAINKNAEVVSNLFNKATAASSETTNQALELLSKSTADQTSYQQANSQSYNEMIGKLIANESELAQHVQSNGTDRQSATLNWIIAGVLGLAGMGLYFAFRKS